MTTDETTTQEAIFAAEGADAPAPKRRKRSQEATTAPEPAKIAPHPLRAMRNRSVPLVGIETADPAATEKACIASLNGKAEETPVFSWDIVRGIQPLNQAGENALQTLLDSADPIVMMNPTEALAIMAKNTPRKALYFIYNAHLLLSQNGQPVLSNIQAVWNCRDKFAKKGATLVMFAPAFKLPPELSQDVVLLTETAPTDAEILAIVDKYTEEAELAPEKINRQKALDGLTGYLSAFAVAQSYAIALTQEGPDYKKLWELKVQALKQTAGLEITMPEIGFGAMAGNQGVKDVMRRHLAGKEPPRAVLWLDEIEKMLAAAGSDLSGTTQAVLEQFLYWTQSRRVKAFLLAGIPGAGKSLTCQAVAGEAKCPLLRASMSTVKGGLVGETEANAQKLFKAVDAVAQGRVLMLATCNSLDALSPEVMSRFNMGMFFYDYPNTQERAGIIEYYRAKYPAPGELPNAQNWVGREIESCFEKASLWGIPLEEAAKTVVPAAIANKDKLNALRRNVSGRFLSAAKPGLYTYSPQSDNADDAPRAARKLEL